MDGALDSGRLRRTARRGIAVATLGWLLAMAGSVLAAPTASAAPTATVEIRTLTPPVVSIDAGGTATFVNAVASYPAQVSLPLVGTLGGTVSTDVSVTFNGTTRALQAGQSTAFTFPASTVGAITYTHRVVPAANVPAAAVGSLVSGILATLPPLPVGVPFVVNTLVPLPNLPSANLPVLPPVTVPDVLPTPTVPTAPVPTPGGAGGPTTPTPTAETPAAGTPVEGTAYAYGLPTAAGQMAPLDTSAAAAFDPSRFVTGDAASTAQGGGGNAGTYDGASVPVFGELAGLGSGSLGSAGGDDVATASDSAAAGPDPALSVPALAAVVALSGVSAALVRTHLAQRRAA